MELADLGRNPPVGAQPKHSTSVCIFFMFCFCSLHTMQANWKDATLLVCVSVASCLVGYYGALNVSQAQMAFATTTATRAPALINNVKLSASRYSETAQVATQTGCNFFWSVGGFKCIVFVPGAAAVGTFLATPMAAQATEITTGVPGALVYIVFLILGGGFAFGTLIAIKKLGLMNWGIHPTSLSALLPCWRAPECQEFRNHFATPKQCVLAHVLLVGSLEGGGEFLAVSEFQWQFAGGPNYAVRIMSHNVA